jgi:phenylacetate-CoA ligase
LPDEFWTVQPQNVVETVITSASTLKAPLSYPMTHSDLERLAFNEALSLHGAGVTSEDRAQIFISMDRLSVASMAIYRGLTTLSVNTGRVGVLTFDLQKLYFELMNPTVLIGVPSYLKKFGESLTEIGFRPEKSPVKKIFCVGESIKDEHLYQNSVATKIQELFNAHLYSSYSLTELAVSYCECVKRNGNHAHPELVFTEIVDEHGYAVPDGSVGELVATPFGVEGVALLRYRTGDMTFKVPGACTCGRNSDRLGPILSRKSHIITIKGATIYPLTLFNALDELSQVSDYIITLEHDSSTKTDQVLIYVVTQPAMIETIASHIRAKVRVSIPILLSNSATINALRGDVRKKIRIVDKRKK